MRFSGKIINNGSTSAWGGGGAWGGEVNFVEEVQSALRNVMPEYVQRAREAVREENSNMLE